MATKGQEIAHKIVQQAMDHETAIETKISLATLLIGIEMEFDAAFAAPKTMATDKEIEAAAQQIHYEMGCTITAARNCAVRALIAAAQVRASEPHRSTLARGDEIERDFYHLKAQEWACEADEAERRITAALLIGVEHELKAVRC